MSIFDSNGNKRKQMFSLIKLYALVMSYLNIILHYFVLIQPAVLNAIIVSMIGKNLYLLIERLIKETTSEKNYILN